jgi:hypothetical protein
MGRGFEKKTGMAEVSEIHRFVIYVSLDLGKLAFTSEGKCWTK